MKSSNASRLLFCCHCSLIFLAVGLWSHFLDKRLDAIFLLTGTAAGFVFPFLLFNLGEFKAWGILGLVGIILTFGFAFYYRWDIDWVYFLVATILYSVLVVRLTLFTEHEFSSDIPPFLFKLFRGFDLAFLILAAGLWFHFQGSGINIAFFIGGTAAGLAIPFLLLKE